MTPEWVVATVMLTIGGIGLLAKLCYVVVGLLLRWAEGQIDHILRDRDDEQGWH